MHPCERCGKETDPDSYKLWDYCVVCSKTLCDICMEKGCCGNKPAKSGMDEDYAEDNP